MSATRSVSQRERRLLVLAAMIGLVVVAVQLVDLYNNREAKLLTLRGEIAAYRIAGNAASSTQQPLPVPWFNESNPSRAALRLHSELEERATQLGLRVESIHASAEPQESVEAQARIHGGYAETIAFLAALDQSEPPLMITDLTLARPAKDSGGEAKLDSTIAVRGYLQSNGESM